MKVGRARVDQMVNDLKSKTEERVCSNIAGNGEVLDTFLAGVQVDETIWDRFVSTELSDH